MEEEWSEEASKTVLEKFKSTNLVVAKKTSDFDEKTQEYPLKLLNLDL